jgi:replication factor C subunit 1
MIPPGSIVATTGPFRSLNAKQWLLARGAKHVVWSSRLTHLLVGDKATSWKLQHIPSHVVVLRESEVLAELAKAPKDLWVDRYRPKQLKEVIGHTSQINDLIRWLKAFPTGEHRAAMLTGPPGIGKTTVAHLVAKEMGYEVVEFNASDERSGKAIRELFEKMGRMACVQKTARRLVIMDEVDGMSSGDRGGVAEIATVCKSTPFPIVCIANERTAPKLRPLASATMDVRFSRPTKTTIAKQLMATVCKQEGLSRKQADLERMCEENGNDIRSIVNALQFSAGAGGKDEVHRLDPFSAAGRLFGTGATLEERMMLAGFDHSLVPLMVAEGYIAAAGKRGEDGLERCVAAADHLGVWDLLDRRIHRTQTWGLLPAALVEASAAAMSAKGPAPFQIFPSWLGKHSKRLKHRRMLSDLQTRIHGDAGLLETRSLLRATLFDSAATAPAIVGRLQEFGMTRDDMMETLVETCFKGEEAEVALDTKKKSAITREWKKVAPKDHALLGKRVEVDLEEEIDEDSEEEYC